MNEIKANGPVTMAYIVHKSFYWFFGTTPKGVYDSKAVSDYKSQKGNGKDPVAGGHACVYVG